MRFDLPLSELVKDLAGYISLIEHIRFFLFVPFNTEGNMTKQTK